MSDVIFLAFANSDQKKLDWLYKEYEALDTLLNLHFRERDTKLIIKPFADLDTIINNLTDYKDNLIAFQFSGHAGRDRLILEDGTGRAEGIATLLSECPKLQLVFLNGCSTRDQVELIYNKRYKSYPVIISTSAPVGDEIAMEYSIHFWKRLIAGDTYDQAHRSSEGRITTKHDISFTRSLAIDELKKDLPFWNISTKNNRKLGNKIPKGNIIKITDDRVNEFLREALLEAYAPFNEAVREAQNIDDLDAGTIRQHQLYHEYGIKNYQLAKIVEALPHPISEQLRKLLSKPRHQEEREVYDFFDNLDIKRLKQIVIAYLALIETIAYAHIAQLWHHIRVKKIPQNQIPKSVKTFFEFDGEKKLYPYFKLIGNINTVLVKAKINNFLLEWNNDDEPLDSDLALINAVDFMEKLVLELEMGELHAEQILQKCLDAEEQLSIIYAKLAFIIKYKMVSVRSIGVLKYQHEKKPKFSHAVIELIQSLNGRLTNDPIVRPIIYRKMKYTASVLLENDEGQSIILTPFIIDINAFETGITGTGQTHEKQFPKLLHFVSCQEIDSEDNYSFYHVYKPSDNIIDINAETHHEIIKKQFDDFKKVVLKIN